MIEYFGMREDGVLIPLGVYDCWDDLEYDVNIDTYVYVWTKTTFTQMLSYGVMLLGKAEVSNDEES